MDGGLIKLRFIGMPVGIEEHADTFVLTPWDFHLSADGPKNGVHTVEADASLSVRNN